MVLRLVPGPSPAGRAGVLMGGWSHAPCLEKEGQRAEQLPLFKL